MQQENLEKLLESIRNKIDFAASADNALDGKAGTLMAFEIAIAIGYLSFTFLESGKCDFWLGVAGLVFLTTSIALLFYVNWPKRYTTASVNILEHKEYLIKKGSDLSLQLISDAQNAFTKNNEILGRKTKYYKWAIGFLLTSTLLLILSIIL